MSGPSLTPGPSSKGRGGTLASPLLAFDARAFCRSLAEADQISETDARLAEEVARRNSQTPIRALLDLGLIGEEALADRLAAWCGCARWRSAEDDRPISDKAPYEFMENNAVLLLEPDATLDEARGSDDSQNGHDRTDA